MRSRNHANRADKTALLFIAISSAVFSLSSPSSAAPTNESWQKVQNAGSEALSQARYGDAERFLKQAVLQSAAFGEGDARFARSLGELGRLLTIRGRFSEAEPLLEEELHARELLLKDDRDQLVPVMGSLITFYLEHGTASKADALSDRLLAIIEGRLDEYRTATQGPVTLKKGQPLTAWAGTAALSMRDPVIEWAITCDGIANLYRQRQSFDMADRLYKAALDVKETVLGKEHLSLANSFDSLGTICIEKNEDTEAETFFRYALEHTERILSSDDPQVFPRLDKLAKCLIKEKKFEEAEQLYTRALEFWKKEPSKNGSEARASYALGSLLVTEKKYDAAVPVLQNALQMAEQYHGPNSISLVPYLQRYADAMYYLGKTEERVQLKNRADTISGVGTTL